MKYNFKVKETTEDLICNIKQWFDANGNNCVAVIGISGGKDSTIAAKLCVEALGKDRVYGVLMPNGVQHDLNVAKEVVEYLNINHQIVNINKTYNTLLDEISLLWSRENVSEQTIINLPPRLRMVTLRAICQTINGRLINTSNLSEDWIGYCTIDGDSSGDYSPLSYLTVDEVKKIGLYLGIPEKFVNKVPEDGLTGKSDEEKFGFTYDDLDGYIRGYRLLSPEVKSKIEDKYEKNKFKLVATSGMYKYLPNEEFLFSYNENMFENIFLEIKFLKEYNYSKLPPCYSDIRLINKK